MFNEGKHLTSIKREPGEDEADLEKNAKESFERAEQVKKRIHDVLNLFVVEDDSPEKSEEYIERELDSLFNISKKILKQEGEIHTPPEKMMKTAEKVLFFRLREIEKNEKDGMLKQKARIALLGDEKFIKEERIDIKEYKAEDLVDYSASWSKDRTPLSKKEVEYLISRGLEESLSNCKFYGDDSILKKLDYVPESLMKMIVEKYNHNEIEIILQAAFKKQGKFSSEIFDIMIRRGFELVALKNYKAFENPNVLKAIELYMPDYPFKALELIQVARDQGFINKEIAGFILNNHYLEGYSAHNISNYMIVLDFLSEMDNSYKKAIELLEKIPNVYMKLSEEDENYGLNIIKDLISSGNLGLLYENIDWVKKLLHQDYNWVAEQIEKNDQEKMLLVFDFLKPEQQNRYIGKLLKLNKIDLIMKLMDSSFSHLRDLNRDIYNQLILIVNEEKLKLSAFSNLPTETFSRKIELMKDSSLANYDKWISENIKYFSFPKKLHVFIDSGITGIKFADLFERNFNSDEIEKLQYFLIEYADFIEKAGFSKEKARQFFKDAILVSSEDVVNYINKFKKLFTEVKDFSSGFQEFYIDSFIKKENNPEEKKILIEKLKSIVLDIAENRPILEEDKKLYELACREVYPQRNYNTYAHIDKYKDRMEDLYQYKFSRDGYKILVDGVSEIKIKEGEIINPAILKKYTDHIQKISGLASVNALENFFREKFQGKEDIPETIEGKLLEYIKDKSDDEITDIIFAYQLRDEYENFIGGTRDRAGESSSEIEKEYIMLTELAERFGDRLKDTIKEITDKALSGPDKIFFVGTGEKVISEEGLKELSTKISSDLAKLPADKLNDKIVQKKITSVLKARFQKIPELKNEAENIASRFSARLLANLENDLLYQVAEALKNKSVSGSISANNMESMRSRCFQEIQGELEKYEEVLEVDQQKKELGEQKKSNKMRELRGYFSKNKENAHARMVADVCLADDPEMLENKKYFEFVLFDEERNKNVGTVMLLAMPEPDGKKYLLYCPNPAVEMLAKVSAKKLYEKITKCVIDFAKNNEFDGILFKASLGHSTNRAGKFYEALSSSRLKDNNGKSEEINLSEAHKLGSSYLYKEQLSFVWKK
ncbi:MAG: hypothetical protein WC608_01900 [Parcubacteria group bacterium]